MAKNMGEFEERPRVSEAIPIPLRQRKPTGWIVATVIFVLIAIGMIGYVVVDRIIAKDSRQNELGQTESLPNTSVGQDGRKGFFLREEFGAFYVTKGGDVYLELNTDVYDGAGGKLSLRLEDFNQEKLPGIYGTYILVADDFESRAVDLETGEKNEDNLTIEGYKLDLENIVSIDGELNYGLAWNGYNYALIDADGRVNWVHISPKFMNIDGQKAEAIITRGVGGHTDIANVMSVAERGVANSVMFVKRNGEQIWLDYDTLYKVEGFEEVSE